MDSDPRGAGGRAHSSVCTCTGLRGVQGFCPSLGSQGALDAGFYKGACFPYDDIIKPALVKIIAAHTHSRKVKKKNTSKSLCVGYETGGGLPPATLSLEAPPPALVGDSHPRGQPLRDSQSGLTSKNDFGNYF